VRWITVLLPRVGTNRPTSPTLRRVTREGASNNPGPWLRQGIRFAILFCGREGGRYNHDICGCLCALAHIPARA